MPRSFVSSIAILFIFLSPLSAQEFGYGFKVGLNFSSFKGPIEKSAAGSSVEEFNNNTGFHVGIVVNATFTDLFGLRGQLLFSQKGSEYRFDGESFQFLVSDSGKRVIATGTRKSILTITNSYLDIPIMAYYRIGERFEVFGGASVGFLVGSTASGELGFNGQSNSNGTPIKFTSTSDIDYFDDSPPTAEQLRNSSNPFEFTADGETVFVPKIMGGYYDFTTKDKSVYNILDGGLVGGINFFLNRGLYLGAALHYGLLDVTNEDYDVSRVAFEGNNYIKRSDNDKNFSIQVGLGFSF